MPEDTKPGGSHAGLLVVISGPSGVGKTTITRGVERAIPGAVFSVSVTTRPKTPADRDGIDYSFVRSEQFEAMQTRGELLESATVFGRRYGTPRRWVEDQLGAGRVVLLEIDVEGGKQVRRAMPGVYAVFILPPSEEELLTRLRERKREPEDAIQRRFAEARREIAEARACGCYDAFLINADLPRAISEAVELITKARARTRSGGRLQTRS